MGKVKLNKRQQKLVAKLWAAGLLQNHEAHFTPGYMDSDSEAGVVNEIFKIADKLQGEHPKFGSIYDAVGYVTKKPLSGN